MLLQEGGIYTDADTAVSYQLECIGLIRTD